jgi:hypothetical protein
VKVLLLLVAAPLLAQEPPPIVKLKPLDLSFEGVQLPGRPGPPSLLKIKAGIILQTQAKICAIPLIQVTPKGNYLMPVVKPKEQEPNMPKVNVPAPACE